MSKSKSETPRFRFAPAVALESKRVRLNADPIESYEDRQGFLNDFIGKDFVISLPQFSATMKKDVVTFDWKDKKTHVLLYTHFSTAVSKSRRMPIFSACNIDGARTRPVPRTDVWKFDPRIPQQYQILKEIYGNEKDGFFSRGHMTRRQDPDWGSKAESLQADADTFHATNAAPQVQSFNGGLWGDIEDYILANTKQDSMRVSVMTGPVFAKNDPKVHGIQVPVRFWKVVAFLHDETERLTATGYIASQAKAIADLKPTFVFGDFENQQRPLVAIEKMTGLSFGKLTNLDVLAGAGTDFAARLNNTRDIMLA